MNSTSANHVDVNTQISTSFLDALDYLKAYYLPVVIFVGLVLNVLTILASVQPKAGEKGECVVLILTAIGNILVLFFRPAVNFWFGDGLNYSTSGATYVYLDQVSSAACRWWRGAGFVSEVMPIALVIYEAVDFASKSGGQPYSSKRSTVPLLVTLVYVVAVLIVIVITCYYTVEVIPLVTSLSGQFCTPRLLRGLNCVVNLLLQLMLHVVPTSIMVVSCFVAMARLRSRKPEQNGDGANERPEHDGKLLSVFASAVAYSVFLWPIVITAIMGAVQAEDNGEPTVTMVNTMLVSMMISFLLPIADFLCAICLRDFRRSLRTLFGCNRKRRKHRTVTLVAVVTTGL